MVVVTVIVVTMVVVRVRSMGVRVVVVVDLVAARVSRMRTGDGDRARDEGADQRQKNDCLDHRALALHQIDVFNRNRAAVAEIDHENGKADRGFRGSHRQDQQRIDLPDDVADEGRERHQVDVDRKQDQLDRHQDDDDVLAVEEDAENPEREQDRSDGKVMPEPDDHCTHSAASVSNSPCPEATLRTAIAISGVRAFWTLMSCRLTLTLCRKVSTMAPIIATSSTMPASWK